MKAYRCLTSQDLMDVITKLEAPRKKRNLFRKLIQYPEPERLLERLHELIDGENGAAVGSVLLKCMQLGYLKKTPTPGGVRIRIPTDRDMERHSQLHGR